MATQFSKDGKYFAQLSNDGKLKLWNTVTNKYEQEYTPDFHLTSPCICLHFILPVEEQSKAVSPRKKIKRRKSTAGVQSPYIVLGTTNGLLLCYSIVKGDLDFKVDSKIKQPVGCISWQDGVEVFSAIEQNILCWDLQKQNIKSKWKGGNEKISAILKIPDSNKLVTASRNIKLWDIDKKEVLATYTGHSTEVSNLHFVNPSQSDCYFLSCSKGDRLVSAWNLDSKIAVASYLTEDIVYQLSSYVNEEGVTYLAAVTRSGVCHAYRHTLNGKGGKPIKAKTTIQVVSDTDKGSVTPIPIVGAFMHDASTLTIGHGSTLHLVFENLVWSTYEKVHCIIRNDIRNKKVAESAVSKTKAPIVDDDVNYLTPHMVQNVSGKRKSAAGTAEVPMEKRLDNLSLNKLDGKVPRANNVAQLLLQALHSKDKNMLKTALNRREEDVVQNTVKRLPMNVIVPLVDELTTLIQGKTLLCQTGVVWLKAVLQIHSGLLASNPELSDLLSPVMSGIESRLNLQTPLNKLRGRLDLLVCQLNVSPVAEQASADALLVYTDKASSDSELDGVDVNNTDSEPDWFSEESDDDVDENGDDENSVEEMSS